MTTKNEDMDTSKWLHKFLQAARAVDLTPLQLFTAATCYKAWLDQDARKQEAKLHRPTLDDLQSRVAALEHHIHPLGSGKVTTSGYFTGEPTTSASIKTRAKKARGDDEQEAQA